MKNNEYIDALDHINHAKNRIAFLCSMFDAVNTDRLMFNEEGITGLTQNLWDIDDVLTEVAEFINSASGRNQKRAPAKASNQAEAQNPDQD